MTNLAHSYRLSVIFVYSLFAVACFSVVAYLILTTLTIFATSHRSSYVRKSALLTSEIGGLEQLYLTLQSRLTPEQALALGLTSPKNVTVLSVSDKNISLR